MSCSMTIDAVKARAKTVTRRHVDTWKTLKPGDRLTLIEKGMGLTKGERQVVLAEVEVVSISVEPLAAIFAEDHGTAYEGLPGMSSGDFVLFWANSHGYATHPFPAGVWCRRIEWRYIIPCGGCGEPDPKARCLGCLHDFSGVR
jgi:hypothetical protein